MNPKDPMAGSVTTPVLRWIWERDLYNQIIKIPVFKKFRLWKGFIMWHLTVRNNKSTCSRYINTHILCHQILCLELLTNEASPKSILIKSYCNGSQFYEPKCRIDENPLNNNGLANKPSYNEMGNKSMVLWEKTCELISN